MYILYVLCISMTQSEKIKDVVSCCSIHLTNGISFFNILFLPLRVMSSFEMYYLGLCTTTYCCWGAEGENNFRVPMVAIASFFRESSDKRRILFFVTALFTLVGSFAKERASLLRRDKILSTRFIASVVSFCTSSSLFITSEVVVC